MSKPIPNYGNLDLSGEAQAAAARMEARATELASADMFHALIEPLLQTKPTRILDVGCGTGAMARRIAHALPESVIVAVDKSHGMLQIASRLAKEEGLDNVVFLSWDATDEEAFPGGEEPFGLIFSSVMMIYLEEAEAKTLVHRLAARLEARGVLAFLEQDHMSDSLNDCSGLFLKIMRKDERQLKLTQALGLRSVMRQAGLLLLRRKSFLWTDDGYGAYTRELLTRFTESAREGGIVSEEEAERFLRNLEAQSSEGEFYYGIAYHLISAAR